MKTKEELNALKNEVEALDAKLAELTEEELQEVVGGFDMPGLKDDEKYVLKAGFEVPTNDKIYEHHIYKMKNGQE